MSESKTGPGLFVWSMFLVVAALLVVFVFLYRGAGQKLTDLTGRVSGLEADLEDRDGRIETLQTGLKRAGYRSGDLQTELDALKAEKQTLLAEAEKRSKELAVARKERDEHLAARVEIESKLDAALSDLAGKR